MQSKPCQGQLGNAVQVMLGSFGDAARVKVRIRFRSSELGVYGWELELRLDREWVSNRISDRVGDGGEMFGKRSRGFKP